MIGLLLHFWLWYQFLDVVEALLRVLHKKNSQYSVRAVVVVIVVVVVVVVIFIVVVVVIIVIIIVIVIWAYLTKHGNAANTPCLEKRV